MKLCSHSGVSTLTAKKAANARLMVSTAMEKPRCLKTRRSTIGCSACSSQIMKAAKPTTATAASATIMGEANQSRFLPSSSISCSEPTQTMSRSRPTVSMGFLSSGCS